MAVFKDDELACEILSGKQPMAAEPAGVSRRTIALTALGVTAICGVAFAIFFHKTFGHSATVSAVSPAVPAAPAAIESQPAEPQKLPAPSAAPQPRAEVVSLPVLSSPAALEAAPKPEPAPKQALTQKIPDAPVASTPPLHGGAEAPSAPNTLFEDAKRAEEKANGQIEALENARALYQHALESGKLETETAAQCVAKLTDLANKLVLDSKCPCMAPKAVFHKVESGDVADKIARKYKVNIGQIKRINHLNDKVIVRLGQTLKLLPGDVLYKVDRTHLTGTLYIDGVFIRQYPVGVGPGDSTPVGGYTIENKVLNPDWWYDGKKVPFGEAGNILGTRWMGFSTATNGKAEGLGVHGTAFPDSVPGRESKGCVRMHNADVEELYDFMPQGGKVEIRD